MYWPLPLLMVSKNKTLQSGLSITACVALVALVWLSPLTYGPSMEAVSFILGAACLGLLALVLAPAQWAPVLWLGTLSAALLSAAMGVLQYLGWADGLAPWVSAADMGQAYANLRQPNQFATLCSMGLLALLCGAAHARQQTPPLGTAGAALLQGWRAAAAVLLACGAAASASRTGLVQWVLIALLWWLWRRRGGQGRSAWWQGPGVLLVVALASYALAAWMLPMATGASRDVISRLVEGVPGCSSRMVLWANVLHLISLKPWLGWGWGELDYAHFITPYPGLRFCAILDNAHNLPLHLAVELGVPVALAACMLLAWLVWRAQPWREQSPWRQMAWAMLTMMALHSLVEYPLWYGQFQLTLALCVAVLLWVPRSAVVQGAPAPARLAALRVGALLWLVLVAWVALDYARASQVYIAPEQRMAGWRTDTLAQAKASVRLFREQVIFAQLNLTPLTADNAALVHALASWALHISPEPRVIEPLIESLIQLGRESEAQPLQERYLAAFPQEYAQWRGGPHPTLPQRGRDE